MLSLGDNLVYYGWDLSHSSPKVRQGKPAEENRFFTSAADGPMPALTLDLARKANIARLGSTVLLFYPKQTEDLFWILEKQYSGDRETNDIRATVFTVVRDGKKFAFEVIDQKYF